MHFRFYRRGSDDVLHHAYSGEALGGGRTDIGFIVDGIPGGGVVQGDVLEVGGSFLMIDQIDPPSNLRDPSFVHYQYLPVFEDEAYQFGDGNWSPLMISRLRSEAWLSEEHS